MRDVQNGIVYILGTGIGGGIIINGELYSGSHFAAGEFSGVLSDLSKPLTIRNMMASQISASGMLNHYQENTQENVDGYVFFDRIKEDKNAQEALNDMASKTAAYLYNIQLILDVERIAIGGGVSEQPVLLEKIREHYRELYAGPFPLPCHEAEIVKCSFGNDSNLIGALYWHLKGVK